MKPYHLWSFYIAMFVWVSGRTSLIQSQNISSTASPPSQGSKKSQSSQLISLDYNSRSRYHYGIPLNFTMPDLTEVTMCAWVKHGSDQLQRNWFSSYISYKEASEPDGRSNSLGLYTGSDTRELLGLKITGRKDEAFIRDHDTFYDGDWHSACGTWESSRGKTGLFRDGLLLRESENFQEDEVIKGGGTLVICQRWFGRNFPYYFQPNMPCYGVIGSVEMWDYFADAGNIDCLSNCWSVGNLFHFDWTEMEPIGNLSALQKLEYTCPAPCWTREHDEIGSWSCSGSEKDNSTLQELQMVSLDYGNGSNSHSHYGIPLNFTMPDLTEVTMCAWVKRRFDPIREYQDSYYFSYKESGTSMLALSTGWERGTIVHVWIAGLPRAVRLNIEPDQTISDGLWHSVCATWRSSDGRLRFFRDGAVVRPRNDKNIYFQKGKSINGGGDLLVYQYWEPTSRRGSREFQSYAYCYGELGPVDIWDFYLKSPYFHCVSKCGSVGNLFHFDWKEMKPEGRLDEVPRNRYMCPADVNTPAGHEDNGNTQGSPSCSALTRDRSGLEASLVSIDYGSQLGSSYGIPINFRMPELTDITMCAWVKYNFDPLQALRFSSYLSYKVSQRTMLSLFSAQSEGSVRELIGVSVAENSPFVGWTVSEASNQTLHDGAWHSVCTTWRSSDGHVGIFMDGVSLNSTKNIYTGLIISGGGKLVICQEWSPTESRSTGNRRFRNNTNCYEEIGSVEMWDYSISSLSIDCVSKCGSVGNLFHFDWTEMEPEGGLAVLPKREYVCPGGPIPVIPKNKSTNVSRVPEIALIAAAASGALFVFIVALIVYRRIKRCLRVPTDDTEALQGDEEIDSTESIGTMDESEYQQPNPSMLHPQHLDTTPGIINIDITRSQSHIYSEAIDYITRNNSVELPANGRNGLQHRGLPGLPPVPLRQQPDIQRYPQPLQRHPPDEQSYDGMEMDPLLQQPNAQEAPAQMARAGEEEPDLHEEPNSDDGYGIVGQPAP